MFDNFNLSKPEGMTFEEWNEQKQAARLAADAAKLAEMQARAAAPPTPKQLAQQAECEREQTAKEQTAKRNLDRFLETSGVKAAREREDALARMKTPDGLRQAVAYYTAALGTAEVEMARAEAAVVPGDKASEEAFLAASRAVATAKALLQSVKRRAKEAS
jgi:hypothetical protein